LNSSSPPPRDAFVERERHADVRRGDFGYPSRAIRTARYLDIRNLRPDRWPAGDPEKWKAAAPFGDCDPWPTRDLILDRRDASTRAPYFRLGFEKRPEEELYDLEHDPHELKNVAGDARYAHGQAARALDARHGRPPRGRGGRPLRSLPVRRPSRVTAAPFGSMACSWENRAARGGPAAPLALPAPS